MLSCKTLLCTATLALGLLVFARADEPAPPPVKKVLFFSKSSNFEHAVIKRKGGQPSFVETVLAETGPKHGIQFTFSKDGSLFTPEYLAQFDAFMFYTSGDLLAAGTDGNPPMTAAGKAALLDAIKHGKGFIGVHSAADTFHTGETVATNTHQARTWRYKDSGDQADPYIRMLGGELIVHGVQQISNARVPDQKFPGFSGKSEILPIFEEWYSMTNFSHDLHVLLVVGTDTMRDPDAAPGAPITDFYKPYVRPAYPSTWAHMYGEGRVFYSSLGHNSRMWITKDFQDILYGGIAWAVRDVDADVTPNIEQVTPHAWDLPPVSKPVSSTPKKNPSQPAVGL
jgi:type 1 glutamine amidotransferase